MPQPHFFILYVRDTAASAAFYTALLERPPLEASPGFAMFALAEGAMLGLWAAGDVQPPATAAGGAELAFSVADAAAVAAHHAAWVKLGVRIVQPPTDMDFGRTFLALDPDGHRLRVFAAPV